MLYYIRIGRRGLCGIGYAGTITLHFRTKEERDLCVERFRRIHPNDEGSVYICKIGVSNFAKSGRLIAK